MEKLGTPIAFRCSYSLSTPEKKYVRAQQRGHRRELEAIMQFRMSRLLPAPPGGPGGVFYGVTCLTEGDHKVNQMPLVLVGGKNCSIVVVCLSLHLHNLQPGFMP